jgi:hypothetical protein
MNGRESVEPGQSSLEYVRFVKITRQLEARSLVQEKHAFNGNETSMPCKMHI